MGTGIMAFDVLPSCTEAALRAGEPLLGTAVANVDTWLLLEVPGKWEADIDATPLAPAARAWLDAATKRLPRSKVLFIRRDRPSRRLTFFVATSRPVSRVVRFGLASHDELAGLDPVALVSGDDGALAAMGGERAQPLYLVCTHGKRDLCCAKRGIAFERALDAAGSDGEIWQSSHQGGHRFAATALYLPHGIHYGRLEVPDAEGLVKAHSRGRVFELDRYRGRCTLSAAAQFAEGWLREQLDEARLDAFEFIDEVARDAGRTTVSFRAHDRVVHTVVLVTRDGAAPRIASCGAEAASSFSVQEVVRHESRSDEATPLTPLVPDAARTT